MHSTVVTVPSDECFICSIHSSKRQIYSIAFIYFNECYRKIHVVTSANTTERHMSIGFVLFLFSASKNSTGFCSAVVTWEAKDSERPLAERCVAMFVPIFLCDPGLGEGRGLSQDTCTNVGSVVPVRWGMDLWNERGRDYARSYLYRIADKALQQMRDQRGQHSIGSLVLPLA